MSQGRLLSVPNISEGSDRALIEGLAGEFSTGPSLLDIHSDAVHGRSVFTLAGTPEALELGLTRGAEAVLGSLDISGHAGVHPHTGALDVCPIVYPDPADQEAVEAARALAHRVAVALGGSGLPVFLYGELARSEEARERHFFRRGGITRLAGRMASGELTPDYGPRRPHPRAGATLITARPPLGAFNVEVEGIDLDQGRRIASELREAGGGLPGVRAIAIDLRPGVTQISTNVHDPAATTLGAVVREIERLAAPHGGTATGAELIGLIPGAALESYPEHVPIADFDPSRRTIEAALGEV